MLNLDVSVEHTQSTLIYCIWPEFAGGVSPKQLAPSSYQSTSLTYSTKTKANIRVQKSVEMMNLNKYLAAEVFQTILKIQEKGVSKILNNLTLYELLRQKIFL